MHYALRNMSMRQNGINIIHVIGLAIAASISGCTGSSSNDGNKDSTVVEEVVQTEFESQFTLKNYVYKDSCEWASVNYDIQVPTNSSLVATKVREAIYDDVVAYASSICEKRVGKYKGSNLVDIAQYCGSQVLDCISSMCETDYLTRVAEERENEGDEDVMVDILPSCAEFRIKQVYETDKIAVFERNVYQYSGGAHGSYMVSSLTFDLSDGKLVEKFLRDGVAGDMQQLLWDGVSSYFQEYEKDFKKAELMDYLLIDTSTIPLPQNAPTPEAEGLRFSYACYEIASYAVGEINFVIPYSKIKPYMTKEARKLIE